GRHGADPGLPARRQSGCRPALLQEEEVGGPDAEHHERMAIEPILQPAEARSGEIFADRQRIDVADAAAVEVAGTRMMDRMLAAPGVVGGQRQYPEDAADPVIDMPAGEE